MLVSAALILSCRSALSFSWYSPFVKGCGEWEQRRIFFATRLCLPWIACVFGSIDCAGILKLRNADIELRKGETDIGRKNTRVRLVFRVHIPESNGRIISLQAASNPIECCKYLLRSAGSQCGCVCGAYIHPACLFRSVHTACHPGSGHICSGSTSRTCYLQAGGWRLWIQTWGGKWNGEKVGFQGLSTYWLLFFLDDGAEGCAAQEAAAEAGKAQVILVFPWGTEESLQFWFLGSKFYKCVNWETCTSHSF